MKDSAIKILLSEIKYDVRFDSTIRDRIANRETKNSNPKAKRVEYAIPDGDAEDWLVRQIESAIDNVCGELAWCVVDSSRIISDEILDKPDEWSIHLHFSDSWSGNMRALKTYIHKYVCEFVLYQWYRASMPQYAPLYEVASGEWLTKAYQEARSEKVSLLEPWRL